MTAGDPDRCHVTSLALRVHGLALWQRGDYDQAATVQADSLQLRIDHRADESAVAQGVAALAWIATTQASALAATLIGALDRAAAATGLRVSVPASLARSGNRPDPRGPR